MWAMARFDSYPAPALVDEVLATLPPQIASAEPAVRGFYGVGFCLFHVSGAKYQISACTHANTQDVFLVTSST